ncbi:MAG: MFS transporter [Candidatus Korarchaeota archaeon]|nr:MFS transporter [Candidatus Korarchaeota archaeon]MDK2384064.1 MFS transporter [Candidatus Korarchaeota archaeon]
MERRVIKRNLGVMAATWAIMSPFTSATGVYSSLYILELGGSPVEVGLIVMVGTIVLAFSRLIGGYLADTVGRKRILVPMTTLYGASYFLYALAPDWTWVLWGTVVGSVALMYQPAVQAIVADTLPPESRGKGLTASQTPSQLTALAGPPLATVLVSAMGLEDAMRLLYSVTALAVMSAGLLRTLLIETHRRKVQLGFRQALGEYLSALKLLKGDLGRLLMVTSSVRALYRMSFPFAQIYAVKILGVSEEFWGLISTAMSFESTFTTLISGYLADRVGRSAVMALGYASGATGLGMLALAPKDQPLYVLGSMLIAVAFASRPAAFALMADLTDREVRGKVSAISGLLEGNLSGMMSGVGGIAYSLYPPLPFGIAAIGLIPLTIITWRILPGGAVGSNPTREPTS